MFGAQPKYEEQLEAARREYEKDQAKAEKENAKRRRELAEKRRQYEETVARIEADCQRRNSALDDLQQRVEQRDKQAVEEYLSLALSAVPLPSDFPRRVELAYNSKSEQVIIQAELPERKCVPDKRGFQYQPTKDFIKELPRHPREIGGLYKAVVSQVSLLYIRAALHSTPWLDSIAFNGHVAAVNSATGEDEYPCLVSAQVARDAFPIDDKLRRVTAEECLERHLHAIVSRHPYQLEAIEPILDFDLSKFSFIEGLDAVSTLDSRPNLMEMSYTNFEHLVRQIFEAQGAEGWTTTQSNDDGIDAVIANRKALMGGLSVVQAKQYNPARKLGPSHLRELAGAMEEKKAGWGILITTSTFTSGCEQKAREHGRMELIDGNRLVWLIREHLKKEVLIGPPRRRTG